MALGAACLAFVLASGGSLPFAAPRVLRFDAEPEPETAMCVILGRVLYVRVSDDVSSLVQLVKLLNEFLEDANHTSRGVCSINRPLHAW